MEGSIVQEIEEQWKRERAEAVDYWNRHRRPHPDHGSPDDVDYHYRNKLREREERDRRGRRDDPPRHMSRDEEIAYNEWLADKEEAIDYYRRHRRAHPQLGHPDQFDRFDPRDPFYSRREIDRRREERERGHGRREEPSYRGRGRDDYDDRPRWSDHRSDRGRNYRDDYDDRSRWDDRRGGRGRGHRDDVPWFAQ